MCIRDSYNYEDAILINERLVMDDVFTSIHVEEYECDARDTKLGPEAVSYTHLDVYKRQDCILAIFVDTGWNSSKNWLQQNGLPQMPMPPSIFASSRTPI